MANLESLARDIKNGRNICFITGAGISVASGIRPYRSTPDAMWSQRTMDWCTVEKFKNDPLEWWNKFWIPEYLNQPMLTAKPNAGHFAIQEILQKFPLNVKVITQNVDGLHLAATKGDEDETKKSIVEVHGSLGKYRCVGGGRGKKCAYSNSKCFEDEKFEKLMSSGFTELKSIDQIPKCPDCQKCALPTVLLFDEEYTTHDIFQWHMAELWLKMAERIVFVGTSSSVGLTAAANSIIDRRGLTAYHFNLKDVNNVSTFVDDDYNVEIFGRSEETLPMLSKLL